MPKFLIDENLSPELKKVFEDWGFKAVHVNETQLKGESDYKVVNYAQKHGYTVVTRDREFGEVFFWKSWGRFSAVVLQSKLQGWKNYAGILDLLNKRGVLKSNLDGVLVLVSRNKIRRRSFDKLWLKEGKKVD